MHYDVWKDYHFTPFNFLFQTFLASHTLPLFCPSPKRLIPGCFNKNVPKATERSISCCIPDLEGVKCLCWTLEWIEVLRLNLGKGESESRWGPLPPFCPSTRLLQWELFNSFPVISQIRKLLVLVIGVHRIGDPWIWELLSSLTSILSLNTWGHKLCQGDCIWIDLVVSYKALVT